MRLVTGVGGGERGGSERVCKAQATHHHNLFMTARRYCRHYPFWGRGEGGGGYMEWRYCIHDVKTTTTIFKAPPCTAKFMRQSPETTCARASKMLQQHTSCKSEWSVLKSKFHYHKVAQGLKQEVSERFEYHHVRQTGLRGAGGGGGGAMLR